MCVTRSKQLGAFQFRLLCTDIVIQLVKAFIFIYLRIEDAKFCDYQNQAKKGKCLFHVKQFKIKPKKKNEEQQQQQEKEHNRKLRTSNIEI